MSDTATVLQLDRDMLGDFSRYVPDLAGSGLMVDGETFGALMGIHPRTVRDLDSRGIVVKVDRDRYDLAASLRTYASHLRNMAAGRVPGDREQADNGAGYHRDVAKLSGAYERARLNRAKADAEELKNAAMRRELVKATDVEREWSSVLRGLRSRILATPARVRQRLAHLSASDIAAIDEELRCALDEVARGDIAEGDDDDA